MRAVVVLLSLVMFDAAHAQTYRLPFEGRWFALQAGDTLDVNEHMRLRAQSFGIDFGRVGGPDGRALVRTDGSSDDDYYCWGSDVLAPVDGRVVGVVDGLPDNAPGQKDPLHAAGNHVVLRAASDQYVWLAHLMRGSVAVRSDQAVRRGERLGYCGNSGNTDFPHVHMHVQDNPTFNAGGGRNIVFSGIDVELSGKQFSNVDWPLTRGLFIRNH